jgi:cysteine desulfurase
LDEMDSENIRFKKWTDGMLEQFSKVGGKLNGHPTNRLVHNLNIRFDGVQSKSIINTVSKKIAISAGSACTTQNVEPSHVLLALGLSEDQSHYAIRIGCGRFNTDEDIETATGEILNALKHLSRIHM